MSRRRFQLFIPLRKIPLPQRHPQFRLPVQVELHQRIAHMRLGRLFRDPQPRGDLTVGLPPAGQRGDLLLARRERLPAFIQLPVGPPLRQRRRR